MAMTKLQEELEAIREANDGILRAGDVLAYAEANPESALHAEFEWDDTKAGVQHRLSQARGIIRLNVFVVPNQTQPVRTYVSLEVDRQNVGGGYRHVSEVMSDTDRRQMYMRQAIREIQRWRAKYAAIRELAQIFATIDEIEMLEAAINQDVLDVAVEAIAPATE